MISILKLLQGKCLQKALIKKSWRYWHVMLIGEQVHKKDILNLNKSLESRR